MTLRHDKTFCWHPVMRDRTVLSHLVGILVCMKQVAKNRRSANLARLAPPTLPAAQVSAEELKQRVQSTIRAQTQAAAVRADALAELRRRRGTERTETAFARRRTVITKTGASGGGDRRRTGGFAGDV